MMTTGYDKDVSLSSVLLFIGLMVLFHLVFPTMAFIVLLYLYVDKDC